MRTTVTQLRAANDDLYQSILTMKALSKNERQPAKVAREMVHVTNAREVVVNLMAAGVRHSNGTVGAANRAYELMSNADDVQDGMATS